MYFRGVARERAAIFKLMSQTREDLLGFVLLQVHDLLFYMGETFLAAALSS